MKTVKFDCKGNSVLAYNCNLPGDNSGEYVPIETANIMRSLIEDLHATLRAINTAPMVSVATEQRKIIGI